VSVLELENRTPSSAEEPSAQAPFSSRQHAAHERPPRDRPDDPVDSDPERLLKGTDRCIGARPEDPVYLETAVRIAGEVAELELLLDTTYCVPCASPPHGHDQRLPGPRSNDAVHSQPGSALKRFDGRLRSRAEQAVNRHALAACSEQILQRPHRMIARPTSNHRPRQDHRSHGQRITQSAAGQLTTLVGSGHDGGETGNSGGVEDPVPLKSEPIVGSLLTP